METIILLVLGVLMLIIGAVNMTGNISTVHSYHRKNVQEEDVPKYGRKVGLGTVIIGTAMVISFVLTALGQDAFVPYVIVGALVLGGAFILYAQFKYNKGIF